MHNLRRAAALASIAASAALASAQQRAPNAEAARPTAGLIESTRVGGFYTGSYRSPLERIGLPSEVAAAGGGFGGRRFVGAPPESLALLSLPRLGTASVRERRYLFGPEANAATAQYTSGMAYATSRYNPPMAYVYAGPPLSPLYAPPPDADPFRAFFSLRDADAAEQAAAMDERTYIEKGTQAQATLTSALRANAAEALGGLRQQAIDAFKAGDYESAIWMCSSVRRMDKRDFLPSLLAMHAAMTKERLVLAHEHLMQAVDRKPDLFIDPVDVKQYFGDGEEYERQMRRISRLPDESPPGDLLLKVYAAWRLGDKITAGAALRLAREKSRDEPQERDVIIFTRAMEPALK